MIKDRKSSNQVEADLCRQIETIRLTRNITQKHLADAAGISRGTVIRMEKGAGCTLNTFIRVLGALSIDDCLDEFLPVPTEYPHGHASGQVGGRESGVTTDQVRGLAERNTPKLRQRARPAAKAAPKGNWQWADEEMSA